MGAAVAEETSRRRTRRIVSNTGPLPHLHEIGRQELIAEAGDIYVPDAVVSEVSVRISSWRQMPPEWICIVSLSASLRQQTDEWISNRELDRGEAEAIALTKQLNADWFLTDDNAARTFAVSMGLRVRGSLGVVLCAAETKRVSYSDAEGYLDRLSESSLWIADEVIHAAKVVLHEYRESDPT
ncbi:MAG: hypothetical protein O3A46_10875 [Candidatus Poribacteria bacterium]|nr:hypothetical protein [Candidatus Poribacteria bacterium]